MFEPWHSRLVVRTRTLLHSIVPLASRVAGGRGLLAIYVCSCAAYIYGMILNEISKILFAIIEMTCVDDIYNIYFIQRKCRVEVTSVWLAHARPIILYIIIGLKLYH